MVSDGCRSSCASVVSRLEIDNVRQIEEENWPQMNASKRRWINIVRAYLRSSALIRGYKFWPGQDAGSERSAISFHVAP